MPILTKLAGSLQLSPKTIRRLLYVYIGFFGLLYVLQQGHLIQEPHLSLEAPALAQLRSPLSIDLNLLLIFGGLSLIPFKWPSRMMAGWVVLGTSEGLVRITANLTLAQLPAILVFLLQMGSSIWLVYLLATISGRLTDHLKFGHSNFYVINWWTSLLPLLKRSGWLLILVCLTNLITRACLT
ncbi:hypothetical protein [Levilactobacillus namurensis]|uniref:hypothetical protein n=1 Tax=Levilactobacillus namurensis TaxID=380393 RepID=UPI00222E1A81|nr:hypothetical protein [Levilactobacillus namurensis]MDT7019675.1 hypothetical protein [Levilactobacillus namurensis]WNN65735.1 hypothetical protein RIN67_01185 [Levilactobacillus namurensis]